MLKKIIDLNLWLYICAQLLKLGKFLEPAFIYSQSQCVKAVKDTVKLHICAGSTKLSPLFFNVIYTKTHELVHLHMFLLTFNEVYVSFTKIIACALV